MSESDEVPTTLSIPALARLAKVSQVTVHTWIDDGLLHAEERFQGRQRRRFVTREEWERFAATLPGSSSPHE